MYKKINKKTVKMKPNDRKKHDWYSKECKMRRDIFRKHSRNLSRNPFCKRNLDMFLKSRSEYKKACRKAEKEFRNSLREQLQNTTKYEPKKFWNIIKKMNTWGRQQHDPVDNVSPDKWTEHFKNLLNKSKTPKHRSDVQRFKTFEPILDAVITAQELRDALKALKAGKAPGKDEILVEYLKIFGNTYDDLLLKIVNKIFSSHIYPSKWNNSFLKPIYKKGDTNDPDNFRGLAIGSACAKLFSMIQRMSTSRKYYHLIKLGL